MLAFAVGSFGVYWIIRFIDYSESGLAPLPFTMGPLIMISANLFWFGFLHFAYAFLGNPFPRESKLVWRLSIAFLIFNGFYNLYRAIMHVDLSPLIAIIMTAGYFLMILWSTGLFLRKLRLLKRSPDRPDWLLSSNGDEKEAFKAFTLLTFLMMAHSIPLTFEFARPAGSWVGYYEYFGQIGFLISFVIIYLKYARERTTFLLKLTGLSLTTMLVVLGLAAMMLFPEAEFVLYTGNLSDRREMDWLPKLQSVQFNPNSNNGYDIAPMPRQFDYDLGEDLHLTVEGDTVLPLGFSFPFYNETWDTVFIDANGLVTFGGAYRYSSLNYFFENNLPKIAPYYRALIPLSSKGSGVYFNCSADKATITWHRVRERYDRTAKNENSFQLVLHRDGQIDFLYDRMEALPLYGFRGIRPGGSRVAMDIASFDQLRDRTFSEKLLPEGMTIRFKPDSGGGYQPSLLSGGFIPDIGKNLKLNNRDEAKEALGFQMAFFGKQQDSVIINDNGIVSFNHSLHFTTKSWYNPFHEAYSDIPIIAPFFVDLMPGPGNGVFYQREKGRAIITWHKIPLPGRSAPNTVQLVLHQNGLIDFNYKRIHPGTFAADLWGLFPGTEQAPVDAQKYLMSLTAHSGPAHAGLYEDLNRTRGLNFLQYRHERMLPFFFVVVGSSAFILLIFPLLFRISLVWPLDRLLKGVKQVDAGDLESTVTVRTNDEIGILADNFNRMTTSLKSARAQLSEYAEGLEEKVAERTADLQQTLNRLTETQDRLIHAEKMASLGQLTAGIAHEIKNPLNFVTNFAELSIELAEELKEALAEGEPIEEVIDDLAENAGRIEAHGQRAVHIVQEMMQHANSHSARREMTDINRLISTNIDFAYHAKRAQQNSFEVQIERNLGEDVGEMEILPQGLGRVLLNLLSNAFDTVQEQASASGGDYMPIVKISSRRLKESVEIEISDNGCGINKENQTKIFEPFFTTKPTGTGIGLGLSISYDIITQGHGGSLTMESQENQGTTFVIRLPVITD